MFARIQALISGPQRPWAKALGYILKLGLSLSILVLIFRRIDLAEAIQLIMHMPKLLLLQVFGLSLLRHFIQLQNWRCALHLNPLYRYQRQELMASYLIALPLRFLIPGGHASLAKIFYLKNSSRLASLISSTTERLFMTWATWTFAAIAAFWHFSQLSLLLRSSLLLFASFMPLFAAILLKSVPKWRIHLDTYCVQAPKMMLLQVSSTVLSYLQYYLILNQMAPISMLKTWLGIALTNVSNSIPITISGLGLREGFAIHFLKDFGFGAEQAVAATLSLFIFQDLIPAGIGAIVLIRAKRV